MRGYRRQTPPRLSRSTLVLLLYTALSLVAVAIAAGRGALDLYRPVGDSSVGWLLVSPAIGVGIGLAVVLLSRLSVRHYKWARRLHTDFRDLLGQLSGGEIMILAVASAVGEELLFRGALMPWIGLWPQAIIFALLHIGPGVRFLPWTVSALLMGLLFGWLVHLTGDLGAPIAAHFTINYMNLRYIARTELPAELADNGDSNGDSEPEAEPVVP
jgi:hypothetical protein